MISGLAKPGNGLVKVMLVKFNDERAASRDWREQQGELQYKKLKKDPWQSIYTHLFEGGARL